ncbi:hypothetical protein PRZ48_014889 [Zasmidium cellare]|uniref:DNA replication checkpoint mediator MRC1 domain-containing protein n=1 Tax=Zasmidium cellare TaxID=395010 RepID=A0ABR0DX11_ZASCE|nr:hypothetical protein PRZ48_014889 [Zasmidium cellare]
MQLLQNQRKLPNGSPKMAPMSSRQTKTNVNTIAHGARTGDAVSDDSDDGDDEGDNSSDDDDENDEPHGFALSGPARIGNGAASRLAGLSPADADMFDDQAIAGAQQIDEEDYDGIDAISDEDESAADEREKNILRSAEKDLIAEFERNERPRTATAVTNEISDLSLADDLALERRTSVQSEDSSIFEDLDLDFNQDPFQGLSTGDRLYRDMMNDAEGFMNEDMSLWRTEDQSRENSAPSSVTQKRVRFDDRASSRTSSMSSEEDSGNHFPDLFDGNDDPLLRHAMFMADGVVEPIYDNESVYDFEDEFERQAYEIDEEESDSHSDQSDFSSDSDDGDTTDEEDPEVLVARVKAMRNASGNASTPASTPNSEPSTPVPTKRPSALARAKTTNGRLSNSKTNDGRPKMGTFQRDPTKARVEIDARGSGVTVECPLNIPESERAHWERARKAIGSRDGSPSGTITCVRTTPRTASSIPKRPLTARSTLGTMFDGNLDFLRNNDEWGIAENIVMSARNNATRASFTSTNTTDDSAANVESDVNMADYVQMESDSDMEEPQSASVMSPTSEVFDDFVSAPQNGNDGDLLGHFDQRRGVISSFRNNQNRARHVSSLAANPAKRAQTSEANALQKGRRAAANTPMTPARKNRASQDITGAGIKKVASPLVQKHRRSRGSSLSGIQQTLALDRFGGKAN